MDESWQQAQKQKTPQSKLKPKTKHGSKPNCT